MKLYPFLMCLSNPEHYDRMLNDFPTYLQLVFVDSMFPAMMLPQCCPIASRACRNYDMFSLVIDINVHICMFCLVIKSKSCLNCILPICMFMGCAVGRG